MRCKGYFPLFHNLFIGLPARYLPAAAFVIFGVAAATASGQTVDPKKTIKEATKLTRAGQFVEAEDLLRKLADAEPMRTEPRVELAYVLTKQRRLGDAYRMITEVVEKEPKNARALAVFGATMLTGGRFREARVLFFNAIKNNRREHLAWAGYGLIDFYENRIDQSVENLREAVFYAPEEPDYLFALAQVSARAELYAEAADAYRDFLGVSNKKDTDRRERIKGLISFLRYLGNAGSLYRVGGAEQTAVNFDLVGNRPIIEMRINGKDEPLRFVLDTGSGISVISEKTAKRMKIKPVTRGGHARGIGGDGKFEIVYGLLREIEVGDVTMRQVPVYIRKFHTGSHEVDGYIGLAMISKFLTTIDYGKKTFSLVRRRSDEQASGATADSTSLPLRLTSSGFLSGEVLLQGVDSPLNFIVDTGASVSVISDEVAREDGVAGFVGEEKLRVIGSAGVTDDVTTYKLPKVTFGPHTETDITAVKLDLGLINEASGFEQSGILGGNFLKNYRMTFDFKNSTVTFVKSAKE